MSTVISTKKRTLTGGSSISAKKVKIIPTNEIDEETNLSKCFHTVTAKLYISLAPMFFNDPIKGVKQQHLDPLLMSYFSEARGIILSYSNIKFLKDNYSDDGASLLGTIKFDTPFAFMWISVNFLVWRPMVGDIIKGYSYMQSPSHIGLLIHDTFNANIKKYYIPNNWEFVPNADDENQETEGEEESGNNLRSLGYWVDENGVKVDGELQFTIRAIHSAGKFVSVEGTLIKPGQEEDFGISSEEKPHQVSTHKKFFDEDVEDTTLTVIPEPAKEGLEDLPKYDVDSDEEKVIAEADSSEDEDED
ncbi:DNA-directed RNA polymerase I subunit [Saccharomycopsis crataegensis]|uniref:DNA-directed RNA polymerase subunit n=1 Tax=Saccharomycopsis crataegensis TaxID=43959 RepID=A0AAV5QNI4_9ASCO|nr:DNA-directed RNA polymerase I subunit [Saccharomycopsis crataegensis]